MVSIIPGMESRAPERTEKRRGLVGSPNVLPCCFSTFLMAALSSPAKPEGI